MPRYISPNEPDPSFLDTLYFLFPRSWKKNKKRKKTRKNKENKDKDKDNEKKIGAGKRNKKRKKKKKKGKRVSPPRQRNASFENASFGGVPYWELKTMS
jgi:hypothetical protein